MESKEHLNWIRLCLLREAGVEQSRKSFRKFWNGLVILNPSGNPWESTPADGEKLWGLLKASDAQFEAHEESYIKTGELEAWELQILAKVFGALGLSDCDNLALDFRNIFAGIMKKTSCTNQLFEQAFCAATYVFESKNDILKSSNGFDPSTVLNRDTTSENHLKVMEIVRKGNMLRIFKKNKKKAITVYGEAVEIVDNDSDETLVISCILRSAFELAEKDVESAKESGPLLLRLAERMVKIQPNCWLSHVSLGKVHKLLGSREHAMNEFSEAQKLAPARGDLMNLIDEENRGDEFLTRSTLADSLKFLNSEVGLKVKPQSLINVIAENMRSDNEAVAAQGHLLEGQRFEEGFAGSNKDLKMAAECYRKAAELGDPKAMCELARLYRDGIGLKKDLERSAELLQKAVRAPCLSADNCRWFHKSAGDPHPGVADAMLALGEYYHHGIWYPKNPKLALDLFFRAIECGNATAAFYIGCYYSEGLLLKRDVIKAGQFWKMAADVGHGSATYNLAIWSLQQGDVAMAKEWFKRAKERMNVEGEDEEHFKRQLKKTTKNVSSLQEGERKAGIVPEPGSSYRGRLEQLMVSSVDEKVGKSLKQFFETMGKQKKAHPQNIKLAKDIDHSLIFDYAMKGFSFAQKMAMAIISISRAADLLRKDVATGVATHDRQIVHEIAEYYRTNCEFACGLPEVLFQPAFSAVKRVLSEINSEEAEIEARICWVAMNLNSFDPAYAAASVAKFPNEPLLWALYISILAFREDYSEAKKQAAIGLQRFPKHVELTYFLAVNVRLSQSGMGEHDDVIKAYQNFIDVAPKDHRKLPEAYYCLALCNVQAAMPTAMKDQLSEKALHLPLAKMNLKMGKKAEGQLLPCFLPYSSTSKDTAERLLNLVEHLPPRSQAPKNRKNPERSPSEAPKRSELLPPRSQVPKNQKKPKKSPSEAPKRSELVPPRSQVPKDQKKQEKASSEVKQEKASYEVPKRKGHSTAILSNPLRGQMIKEHRKMFVQVAVVQGLTTGMLTNMTLKPPKKQCAPGCSENFKPITLKEMDATKDRVFTGRRLTVTCIEDGHRMTGIMFIVDDENGDTQRMCVYNTLDSNPRLVYGSKVTILNPYMRIAQDGRPMIRVDDPASILYHDDEFDPDRCRFCGGGGSGFKCGKCQRVKYCTKDCQTKDWKIMKHSLICK